MLKIEPSKTIMHNLEIIRDRICDLKKYKEIGINSKISKNLDNIEKELDKISSYYNRGINKKDLNITIKKKIIIKNKKTSQSFSKWLFNNNEL